MFRIEIADTNVKRMKGTSKRTGNDYDMAMQEAYLHKGGKYPEKFEVPLLKNDKGEFAPPYAVGYYVPSAESYEVRDGRFSINAFELRLVPESDASAPKVAAVR